MQAAKQFRIVSHTSRSCMKLKPKLLEVEDSFNQLKHCLPHAIYVQLRVDDKKVYN